MDESNQTTSPRPAPDIAALTRAMTRGDEAAYRMFYDAYYDRLLRYLLVVTGGNEQAAHEALQAALIRVVRHVRPFDAEEKFWSWLTVLARTALVDESRKQRRWFAFLERFSSHAEVQGNAMNNGEADKTLVELLARNVSALPAEEQDLIERKYVEHRSIRDIANALKTTEKAVESRLSRIRQKLKEAVFTGLKK